ncbi:MAG: HAD family hydrolase [Anaerolineae bacterium]|nr:HAD family hydrolase [Anaerolineae bacterium]
MIKAITFDFWSTLYQSKTVDYNQRLLQLKHAVEQHSGNTFDLEQFQAAMRVARETWSRTWLKEYRTISTSEWLRIMLDELGVSLAAEHFSSIKARLENSVLDDLPDPVPEIKTVLPHLANYYKLAIISDTGLTPGRVLRQVLQKDKLNTCFSHFTFSDETGRSKPHAQVFLATLQALDVKPSEAVHVGDLLRTDIAGAQNVGMRAVQYVGVSWDKNLSSSVLFEPDKVIQNHAELIPLLQTWNELL